MGLLDGLLGQVLGGAMNPPDHQDDGNPGHARSRSMPGDMGGLDSMLGGALGGGGGRAAGGAGGGALMAILLQLLQKNGGLGGLLSQFQKAGYGERTDSWVSPGQNLPIDGDILSKVLGRGQLDEIAGRLGVPREEAAEQVASALPDVVNHMTPQGAIPSNSEDLVNRALEILQRGGR
ncbi:MAG: YidB family protein [Betaproteobacteria bacterium]